MMAFFSKIHGHKISGMRFFHFGPAWFFLYSLWVLVLLCPGPLLGQDKEQPGQSNPSYPVKSTPDLPIFYDDVYVSGAPDAKVVVEEYASVTCPHCARFDQEVMAGLKAKYINKGKIRFLFHEFLTAPVELAAIGFLTARCGGKNQYFAIVEDLFRLQPDILQNPSLDSGPWLKITSKYGISPSRLRQCLTDPEAMARLNHRMEEAANNAHIDSTPTLIINGQKRVPEGGAWTLTSLSAVIDPLLKAKP